MDKQILLLGVPLALMRELRELGEASRLEIVALPELRSSALPDALRVAALVLLHEDAAPAPLPAICAHLRAQTKRPLLILLREATEAAVTDLLEAGADDALSDSLSARELLARLRAHLRRDQEYAPAQLRPALTIGPLHLDTMRHEVTIHGRPLHLTPREFALLEYLARQAGRAVSREELLANVWGYGSAITTRTLDVHIGRLRQKIETDPGHPRWLLTVVGFGYKLATDTEASAPRASLERQAA